MKDPSVSIIIPCKTIDAYTTNCVKHCLNIQSPSFEILILPDDNQKTEFSDKRVRIVPTGSVKPMEKRFLASDYSKAEILALIDSDAFPTSNWLTSALPHFKDSEVAAVSGPSLTPEDDGLLAQVGGLILSSPFGGGSESIRYDTRSHARYVTEIPACNFIVQKSVLQSVRNSVFDVWPGEEIALCKKITNDLNKKIVYDPEVTVYHHRRPFAVPHLKQIWNYGVVKGFIVKKQPQCVRPIFLLPSLLVLLLVIGFLAALLYPIISQLFAVFFLAYLCLALINGIFVGIRQKTVIGALLVSIGTVLTHLCYGIAFIKGLLSRKMM